jgi:single-strand DNA-binding protein
MANETSLTVIGRLTDDPQLRFTPDGQGVANFRVASNARFFDKEERAWKDKPPIFLDCAAWGTEFAQNVHESLHKGDRVSVTGDLEPNVYKTKDGVEVQGLKLRVGDVGASLRFNRASVTDGTIKS